MVVGVVVGHRVRIPPMFLGRRGQRYVASRGPPPPHSLGPASPLRSPSPRKPFRTCVEYLRGLETWVGDNTHYYS